MKIDLGDFELLSKYSACDQAQEVSTMFKIAFSRLKICSTRLNSTKTHTHKHTRRHYKNELHMIPLKAAANLNILRS